MSPTLMAYQYFILIDQIVSLFTLVRNFNQLVAYISNVYISSFGNKFWLSSLGGWIGLIGACLEGLDKGLSYTM